MIIRTTGISGVNLTQNVRKMRLKHTEIKNISVKQPSKIHFRLQLSELPS